MIRSFVKLVVLVVAVIALAFALAFCLKGVWLNQETSAQPSASPTTTKADAVAGPSRVDTSEAPGDTVERLSSAAMPSSGNISESPYSVAMRYEDNPIAADGEYKDKLLLMHGDVKSIKRRSTDQAEVEIEQRSKPAPRFQQRPVRCIFRRDQIEKLARLWTGTETEIVGVCRGSVGGQVELRDCMLASSWSKRIQPGLGVSAEEVMRQIPGYERCLFGFDKSEGEMQAIYCPEVHDEKGDEIVVFLGSIENPHTLRVSGARVAGRLSPTMIQALSAALKGDTDRVREWLDEALLTFERRDKNSIEIPFGRFVVLARYASPPDFGGPFLSDAEKQERAAFLTRPENQALSVTITTSATPVDRPSSASRDTTVDRGR